MVARYGVTFSLHLWIKMPFLCCLLLTVMAVPVPEQDTHALSHRGSSWLLLLPIGILMAFLLHFSSSFLFPFGKFMVNLNLELEDSYAFVEGLCCLLRIPLDVSFPIGIANVE